jgi:hypothetical protein
MPELAAMMTVQSLQYLALFLISIPIPMLIVEFGRFSKVGIGSFAHVPKFFGASSQGGKSIRALSLIS